MLGLYTYQDRPTPCRHVPSLATRPNPTAAPRAAHPRFRTNDFRRTRSSPDARESNESPPADHHGRPPTSRGGRPGTWTGAGKRTQGTSPSLSVIPPCNLLSPNCWADQDRRQGWDRDRAWGDQRHRARHRARPLDTHGSRRLGVAMATGQKAGGDLPPLTGEHDLGASAARHRIRSWMQVPAAAGLTSPVRPAPPRPRPSAGGR